MRKIISIVFILTSLVSYSQQKVTGKVKTATGDVLIGTNVFEKGTYNGTVTDTAGFFSLQLTSTNPVLVFSYLGFERAEFAVTNNSSLNIVLHEEQDELEEVVISAGAFAAGEKSRAVMLTPVEMATTASSEGDIYGALSTFPGAQKNAETGQLIVRGGDANETKTYIDGMLVTSPYGSSMPDLPSRGRFGPFMFNGVMFSTGGYSAEYGQALSSVLELQTPGVFDEDVTSISIMNVGLGASVTRNYARSAFSGELAYNNTYPYFAMANHDLDWAVVPQSATGKLFYRQKVGKTGMLKTDVLLNESISALYYSNVNEQYNRIRLRNSNQFIKTTYNTELGEKWLLKSGVALNTDFDKTSLDNDLIEKKLIGSHLKLSLVNYTSDKVTLKFGGDLNYTGYSFNFHVDSLKENYALGSYDYLGAAYLEADVKLNKKLALRVGVRGEYSNLIKDWNIAPRASFAYKMTKHAQVALATGLYYQLPGIDYTKYSNELMYERADHYLFNYQYSKEGRLFRAEVYAKKYHKLVTYHSGTYSEFDKLGNNGDGYANGIDVFWRDRQTIKNTMYWISYSYIRSQRKYKDYPERATPAFVSPHHITVVGKHWIQSITTQMALTYTYSSGRFYNNPNTAVFMQGRTPAIHDISASISYITNIFNQFTVVHLSVSNLLAQDRIYSYRYADKPNEGGLYTATPIGNFVQRTIIIGLFISIK